MDPASRDETSARFREGEEAAGRTLRFATEDHSADHSTLGQSSSHDLDYTNVVDVELHTRPDEARVSLASLSKRFIARRISRSWALWA